MDYCLINIVWVNLGGQFFNKTSLVEKLDLFLHLGLWLIVMIGFGLGFMLGFFWVGVYVVGPQLTDARGVVVKFWSFCIGFYSRLRVSRRASGPFFLPLFCVI